MLQCVQVVEVQAAPQWSGLPSVVTWNNLNANVQNEPCAPAGVSKLRLMGYFLLSTGGKVPKALRTCCNTQMCAVTASRRSLALRRSRRNLLGCRVPRVASVKRW